MNTSAQFSAAFLAALYLVPAHAQSLPCSLLSLAEIRASATAVVGPLFGEPAAEISAKDVPALPERLRIKQCTATVTAGGAPQPWSARRGKAGRELSSEMRPV